MLCCATPRNTAAGRTDTENRYRRERRKLGEDVRRRETYGGRDVDEGPNDRECPVW